MKRQGRGLFSALSFLLCGVGLGGVALVRLLDGAGVRWKPYEIGGFAVSFAVTSCCVEGICRAFLSSHGKAIDYTVPNTGLDTPCPLMSARVLPVLEMAPYCPSCVIVFR